MFRMIYKERKNRDARHIESQFVPEGNLNFFPAPHVSAPNQLGQHLQIKPSNAISQIFSTYRNYLSLQTSCILSSLSHLLHSWFSRHLTQNWSILSKAF